MNARKKIHVDFEKFSDLSEDTKNVLKEFLINLNEMPVVNISYPYAYDGQVYSIKFKQLLVKKISKDNNNQFYILDVNNIGMGGYGVIKNGIGKLKIQNNNLVFYDTRKFDFIYANSINDITIENLPGVSKVTYLLIRNKLFYVDKSTYHPRISVHYINDLSSNDCNQLLESNNMKPELAECQTKVVAREELSNFTKYDNNVQPRKKFVIKTQKHDKDYPIIMAEREAGFLKSTPHFKHTKGPFLTFNLTKTYSHIKLDKKPGIQLDDLLSGDKEHKKMSIEERLKLTALLIDAVIFQSHSAGIIHRDLKPNNILVDLDTMTVTIIDYGHSKHKNEVNNEKVGNAYYRSPEQHASTLTDEKSDCYSLGIIIAYLWGFEPIYHHESKFRVAERAVKENLEYKMMYPVRHQDNCILQYSMMSLAENMTKCNHSQRFDLFKSREVINDILLQHKIPAASSLITDECTRSKLSELAGENIKRNSL